MARRASNVVRLNTEADRFKTKRGRKAEIATAAEAIRSEQAARLQVVRPKRQIAPFRPKTDRQADYADSIDHNTYTLSTGPAGTGKTYVTARKAAEHLLADPVNNVILTRPAVEAEGERLGFLPGTLADKFGPHTRPFMKVLIDTLGAGYVECAIKNERLVLQPMAFMRGEDFKNALIVGDEMQNATKGQFKMVLTRLGEGSRMVLSGDPTQTDPGVVSGLLDAIRRLGQMRSIGVVEFTKDDIVRHDMTRAIIEAYEEG